MMSSLFPFLRGENKDDILNWQTVGYRFMWKLVEHIDVV